jgi:peptide/nickel transport system substrate-binding protein
MKLERLLRTTIGVFSLLMLFAFAQSSSAQQKVLLLGLEDQPKTLDPRYATDAAGMRISQNLLFSPLVQLGYDLQIVPDLAERWEIKGDKIYRFYLKKGIKFQDGQPLTAEDVKFTFEHLKDPEVKSPFAGTYQVIDTIMVKSPLVVEFKLAQPDASFLTKVIMSILPKHILTGATKEEFPSRLIGSGPFRFVSQNPNEIILEKNNSYFQGAPKLDQIVFKIVKDNNTRFLKMQKGELDLAINVIQLDKMDDFKKPPLNEMYTVIENPGVGYNYISFNMRTPQLQDKRVRQAIAFGIDVDELIKYQLEGHAGRAIGLLSPVNWFHEPNVWKYSYDPKKAEQLLEATGLKNTDANGPKPRLVLELKTSNNTQSVEVGRIIQAQLAKIGIKIDLKSYEWGTYYGDVTSGNFQMATMQWAGVTEPDFFYDIFHSGQVPPAGRNRSLYQNPKIDQLTEKGRITLDPKKRKAIYSEVQKIVAEDLPYVSLWHANNISIVKKNITGYKQHPAGSYLSFNEIDIQK